MSLDHVQIFIYTKDKRFTPTNLKLRTIRWQSTLKRLSLLCKKNMQDAQKRLTTLKNRNCGALLIVC
ncbi:hypothetical protein C0J52_09314 [Blattella germanica]|nr:hypothetical protein C0J52_09314 [Blattella germanica]